MPWQFVQHFTIRSLASQAKISTISIYTEECCARENSQKLILGKIQESIFLSSSTQIIIGIKGLKAKYFCSTTLGFWTSLECLLVVSTRWNHSVLVQLLTYCGYSGITFKDFCGAAPASKLTYMHTVHAAPDNSFARLILGCSTQNPQFWPKLKNRFACHLQFKLL